MASSTGMRFNVGDLVRIRGMDPGFVLKVVDASDQGAIMCNLVDSNEDDGYHVPNYALIKLSPLEQLGAQA